MNQWLNSSSRREAHAADEVGVARVAAEVIKGEPPCNIWQPAAVLLEIPFEPGEPLILIAETGIHIG